MVVLPLTDIRLNFSNTWVSKWIQKAEIEQKLLNMKLENTLHVRVVNLFLFVVCHYIYVTKNVW